MLAFLYTPVAAAWRAKCRHPGRVRIPQPAGNPADRAQRAQNQAVKRHPQPRVGHPGKRMVFQASVSTDHCAGRLLGGRRAGCGCSVAAVAHNLLLSPPCCPASVDPCPQDNINSVVYNSADASGSLFENVIVRVNFEVMGECRASCSREGGGRAQHGQGGDIVPCQCKLMHTGSPAIHPGWPCG